MLLQYIVHECYFQNMYNIFFTDLLIDMLGVLASYSITVREMKKLMNLLKIKDDKWVYITKFLKKDLWQQDNRPYTISVSAGPTSFLPDLNTLTEISESM